MIIALLLGVISGTHSEVIVNGGFESEIGSEWECGGCTLERVTDPYAGSYAASISQRQANWAGLTQYLDPGTISGNSYYATARLKLTNQDSAALYDRVELLIHEVYSSGQEVYSLFGRDPHVRQDQGWIEIGGDFSFSSGYSSVRVYIQIEEPTVNYVVDEFSMVQIVESDTWVDEANERIDQLRKSDVTFNLVMGNGMDPDGVELQFDLTKHAFPFGSAVRSEMISDNSGANQAYQDFFYNNFNWAVLENKLKWKQMEVNEDQIDYTTPEAAIDTLIANDIPVRGHCVTWGVQDFVPPWLLDKSGEEVLSEITDRINGVVGYFAGRLVHWDIDNEDLHGGWFQEKTGVHDLHSQLFIDVHAVDPDALLFINDYDVVRDNYYTVAQKQLALTIQQQGGPIYGIGAQAHFNYNGENIHVVKARLDKVAEAGLPIWISELDVQESDVNTRANRYENLVRLFFAHEAVEGLLLWGFWDGAHWCSDCVLAEGSSVTPNAAGLRWQELVHQEWQTNEVLSTASGLSTRAFHGDYHLTVRYYGDVYQEQDLTVTSGTNIFDINIGTA